MANHFDPESRTDSPITRRRVLATTGTLGIGGLGVAALGSTPAMAADVTMGQLSVSDDSAVVDGAPTEIAVAVSGEYSISGPSMPDQARTVLQIEVDGSAGDLDEAVFMDSPSGGTYSMSANIYDHRNVERGDFLPSEVGQVRTTTITIRVILLAVSDGSIQTETFTEDTADLTLTKDGLKLAVGGSGSVEVVSG